MPDYRVTCTHLNRVTNNEVAQQRAEAGQKIDPLVVVYSAGDVIRNATEQEAKRWLDIGAVEPVEA